MTVQFIIGIDGGGTKTVGRIENLDTGEHYEHLSGSSSLTNDFEGACTTLVETLESLMSKADCVAANTAVVMGLAGAGNQSQVIKLKRRLAIPFASLEVYNDARTSLFGANQGKPAAMVALGTGSVGAMLDEHQQEHYVGGWGFPIGDEGGGAKLGYLAIQSLHQEIDQYETVTSKLGLTLLSKIGPDKDSLLNWLRNATPADYASLVSLIFDLAESCERAKAVINQHANHVEQLIHLTRKDKPVPLVLMGGLAQPTLAYLSDEVRSFCRLQSGSSLDGACLLAKQNAASVLSNKIENVTTGDVELHNDQKNKLLSQLNHMVSEGRNPKTMQIDLMETKGILEAINCEDQSVPLAIEKCIGPIAKAVDVIVETFHNGGRLVYIGAGTSGRLGILDAVECPPTFGVSQQQVIGIIAGGNQAIYQAVEGAEDNIKLGQQDLENINFSNKDVLVGIAASGRTPYVIGALNYAKDIGASTVSLTCNPGSTIASQADINICPVVGPEVLTGSTRMKSGTAQKLVLNMLTTASMIRSGKSYENLMVDVNASNKKLYARAIRIVMQATQCDANTAEQALEKTQYNAKLAILHVMTNVEPEQGQQVLDSHNGFLRKAISHLRA